MADSTFEQLQDRVGETFTVTERFPIEAGKIAEFAEAIKEDDPMFTDTSGEIAGERGFDDVPAPPTFTIAAAFFRDRQDVEGRPDLDIDLMRALHGEQSFEFERTPVAGDVLTGEGEIADVYQRDGSSGTMTFVELETTYRDQDDEVVLRETSTIIELGEGAM